MLQREFTFVKELEGLGKLDQCSDNLLHIHFESSIYPGNTRTWNVILPAENLQVRK